jgi:hypothetical protein
MKTWYYCRVEVIKVGSAPLMKYDVFERLNTGGSGLEPQEIRNAIFRAVNPDPSFADTLRLSQTEQYFSQSLIEIGRSGKHNASILKKDVLFDGTASDVKHTRLFLMRNLKNHFRKADIFKTAV